LLQSQSQWADALRAEYASIVQYNNSLAAFEFQKGTVLRYDNVNIGEGPLPPAAQVRAIDHDKERSHALVLRQREAGVPRMPTTGIPVLGNDATPISAVMDEKPLPQVDDTLPVSVRSARPPITIPESASAVPASPSTPISLPATGGSTYNLSPTAQSTGSSSNSSGSVIPPSSGPYTYGGSIPPSSSPYASGAMPGPSGASTGMLTPSTPPAGGFNSGSVMKLP
jgi:hypothetical protein